MSLLMTDRRTHHIHLPREAPRRFAAGVLAALGALLLVVAFANNLFKVGPSFESLMGDFRPHLTQEAIDTTRADVAGLGAAGTELQSSLVPSMAQQLGMTPAQFSAFVGKTYPDVATGMQALPQIVTTFDGLVTTLDQQRPLFRSADAIPTRDLPATTVPWSLAGGGVVLVLLGLTTWFRPRLGARLAIGAGAVLLAVPLALSLPQKAADADALNANLEPVYTAALVAQAHDALGTVSAMGAQMQSEMLPGLAAQLNLTPAALQQMLGQQFPATAGALAALPTALPRFEQLVADFEANLDNYATLKPVSFVPLIWTVMAVGLVALVIGAFLLLAPRHRSVPVTLR